MEIARKLAREMEEHKVQSLSRTYVPNQYAVWLSPEDREQFEGYEDELRRELSGYLLEHARRERLNLVSRPEVKFRTDERLRLGEFGIQARLVRPDVHEEHEPDQGEEGRTMVYSSAERVSERLGEPDPRRATAKLRFGGRTELLGSSGATLGRSRDCEIVLDDANVSRRHAEIRPGPQGWTIADLGSTNGTRVNGRSVGGGAHPISPGDRLELGTAPATFEME